MEEWRDVRGYEGRYKISNKGRLKSVDIIVPFGSRFRKIPSKIKKYCLNNSGYCYVDLYSGKRIRKKATIHKLVAIAFLNNPNEYTEVNHIDGDKLNNNSENLEWCSRQYNQQHMVKLKK